MKLTKKLENEIRKVYDTYWDGYMKGDMGAFSVILDEDVKVIGSTEGEVFFNKQEALNFYLPTADQIAGKAELRNRIITIEPAGNLVLVTEQNDFYVLIEDNWTYYAKGRLSTFFHKKDNDWKIIQQHGSMPDIRAVEGEQFAAEKISKENLELRDAVKRRTVELEQKNRELEIEASLERVRTVAMAMNKADDMLDVCRVISEQIGLLHTGDIRNVQTAIFYPDKKIYRNYEYYRRHDKAMVTDVDYTTDKRSSTFAAKMQAGAGEFFTDGLSEKPCRNGMNFKKQPRSFPTLTWKRPHHSLLLVLIGPCCIRLLNIYTTHRGRNKCIQAVSKCI
jgi:ketosteroid isomerase-like protein